MSVSILFIQTNSSSVGPNLHNEIIFNWYMTKRSCTWCVNGTRLTAWQRTHQWVCIASSCILTWTRVLLLTLNWDDIMYMPPLLSTFDIKSGRVLKTKGGQLVFTLFYQNHTVRPLYPLHLLLLETYQPSDPLFRILKSTIPHPRRFALTTRSDIFGKTRHQELSRSTSPRTLDTYLKFSKVY